MVQTRSAAVRVRELVSVGRLFFSRGSVGSRGDVFGQSRADVSKQGRGNSRVCRTVQCNNGPVRFSRRGVLAAGGDIGRQTHSDVARNLRRNAAEQRCSPAEELVSARPTPCFSWCDRRRDAAYTVNVYLRQSCKPMIQISQASNNQKPWKTAEADIVPCALWVFARCLRPHVWLRIRR